MQLEIIRLKTMATSNILGLLLMIGLAQATRWNVTFESQSVEIHMDETKCVTFTAPVTEADIESGVLAVNGTPTHVAYVREVPILQNSSDSVNNSIWRNCFNITGNFLGTADFVMSINSSEGNKVSDPLSVIVIRKERIIDRVFTGSVILLVSLLYINFGCAMDWEVCRKTIKRPIGPAIGFFSQFICMPLVSYGLGHLIFPDDPRMQIGMFFSGISPAGGASNIWTVILGGNVNLSITMTTISTMAAFVMMPFWIFTLGAGIFDRAKLGVPYVRIAEFAVGLVIPLGLGYFIQKRYPRVSKFLVRILKPSSSLLIIAIIIFAIVTNLYLFELFSWKIILAGMGIPWIGYSLGWLLAYFLRQPRPDVTAISIETGVHNTGISIFLLKFSLTQPAADLTTIVPVAIAMMTPVPLTIAFIIKSICNYRQKSLSASSENIQDAADPLSASIVAERSNNYTT